MDPNRQRIIAAITSLGCRVTASDMSTATGLQLGIVNRELNKIASETLAVLEVSKQGTLVYVFPKNVDGAFAANGLSKAITQVLEFSFNCIQFVVRSSFGLLLIFSVVTLLVIFGVALILIMCAADAADGEMGDVFGDGDGLDFDFFDVANLICFFSWWQFTVEPQYVSHYGQRIDLREKGFISNCYSFLFGDGNPNAQFEDEAFKQIAALIRVNHGVVTTEQVAPYLTKCRGDDNMFPVLMRFDGAPEVTDTGNIVYVFPSMMQTTGAGLLLLGELKPYAEEKMWKFTELPMRRMDFVFYFAGANVAGWFCLEKMVHHAHWIQPYAPFIHVMFIYSIFFLAFPMFRQLTNSIRNGVVEFNNNCRKRYADFVTSAAFAEKLGEAQTFAQKMYRIGTRQVAYSSGRDDLEQHFNETINR